MSRYTELFRKFNLAKKALERQNLLKRLPMLPYLVHGVPGFEKHNQLHLEAARERNLHPKEYFFDPGEQGIDDLPDPAQRNPIHFTEYETGWPGSSSSLVD